MIGSSARPVGSSSIDKAYTCRTVAGRRARGGRAPTDGTGGEQVNRVEHEADI